jgi:hypothetical protein
MKTANKTALYFLIGILAVIASAGVANAAKVTVNYRTFPTGPTLDTTVVSTGCATSTADTFPYYQFLFWDAQGVISWSPTVTICVGSGNTVATAWYVATGCTGICGCPPSGCSVTTFAFSIDHDEVLRNGTPIALVTPNSPVAWTGSPSTSVLTNSAESISAASALAFPHHASEPFRYWQELGSSTETPIGIVYQAAQNSAAWVVAFYGPDPCDFIRGEVQSCLEEPGLNCSGLIKELQACETQNREPH